MSFLSCYSVKNAKLSRLHNNANIITLGSRLTKKNTAFKCIDAFIKTKFESGRHKKRVKKIEYDLEHHEKFFLIKKSFSKQCDIFCMRGCVKKLADACF